MPANKLLATNKQGLGTFIPLLEVLSLAASHFFFLRIKRKRDMKRHHHERLVKQSWLERAVLTHDFHTERLMEDDKWNLTRTAKALNRSIGSICEDLLIVSWLKTHERQIKSFEYAKDALAFIREKKKKLMLESVDLS